MTSIPSVMSKRGNGSRDGRKRQKGIGAYTKRARSRSSIVIYSSMVVSIISWQSGRRGSNPRPLAWKANALSTELLPHSLLEAIIWWAVMDSNHRRRKPAELQSAPFGHSGNCPFRFFAVQRYELFVNCANGTAHFERCLCCFGSLIA